MESIYELCFYGGLALAIIFLIATIVLFIVLNIPKVFGDLTGRSAKKNIKEKKQNVKTKDSVAKKEQAKYYNQGSGKITVRETVSEKSDKTGMSDMVEAKKTSNAISEERKALDIEETEVLDATMKVIESQKATANSVLDEEETDVLRGNIDEEETDVLRAEFEEVNKTPVEADGADEETDVLKSEVEVDDADEETDVLKSDIEVNDLDEETDVLKSDVEANELDEETSVLKSDIEALDIEAETDVLRSVEDEAGSTKVLTSGSSLIRTSRARAIYNVVVTHTNERI